MVFVQLELEEEEVVKKVEMIWAVLGAIPLLILALEEEN